MLKKEVLQLLGRKGKLLANQHYKALESGYNHSSKDWFSTGFNRVVTQAVNLALQDLGKTERVPMLSTNTANAVASAIDG